VASDSGEDKLIEISDDQGQMLDLFQAHEQELLLIIKYSDCRDLHCRVLGRSWKAIVLVRLRLRRR